MQMSKGTPKRMEAFDNLNIKTIKVGQRHTAAITEEGDLYTFGNGNWGVLGHGDENNISFNKPKLVETLKKHNMRVKDVCLGEYHTLVLTECGQIWTWGYGGKKGFFNWMYSQEVGALGHGDKDAHFWPKKVDYFKDNEVKTITKIAAGNYHCVAVTEDDQIYTWGRGLYGVLGNGGNAESLEPSLNEEFEWLKSLDEEGDFGIKCVQAADDYSGVVLKDGTLQMWGKNDRGQMGVGSGIGIDMIESENTPKEVDLDSCLSEEESKDIVHVTDFNAGQNTMIIRDSKNRIYKTGLKIDYTPKMMLFDETLLTSDKIYQIASGNKHYVILDKDNQMHVNGTKIFSKKVEQEHSGWSVYDCDELFDGGKVIQMSMNYEIFGCLVKH